MSLQSEFLNIQQKHALPIATIMFLETMESGQKDEKVKMKMMVSLDGSDSQI